MPGLARAQVGAPATLRHTFTLDEAPTDSTDPVTVDLIDANGDAVITDGAASTAGLGTGEYTFTLAGQPDLQILTATWSATIGGTAVTEVDFVEIVGGFFFSLAEGRASDSSLASTEKYTTQDLVGARLETEVECEAICGRAFLPRYRRAVLSGTGTTDLLLPGNDLRRVRAVSMAPRTGGTFTALDAGQLAALAPAQDGSLRRTDGLVWTEGLSNIVVEWECGLDRPPADLIRMAMKRFRSVLNISKTGIPDRATSFTATDGGTYRIDLPGAYKTGLPDVDAAYARYSLRDGAGTGTGTPRPASRTLSYDMRRGSIFHAGIH